MANAVYDIKVDAGNDLAIVGGDFVVFESTAQHQTAIILETTGEYKENPPVGVGAFNYFDDEDTDSLIQAISQQFTLDGMMVDFVKMNKNKSIDTNANY